MPHKGHIGFRSKGARIAVLAACAVLSVAAIIMAVLTIYIKAPELPEPVTSGSAGLNGGEAKLRSKMFPILLLYEGISYTGDRPEVASADRREGVYTFLIAGTSDDYSTDTIMVASFDSKEGSFNLVSIPRDTKVKAARALKKINGAYGVGGVTLLKREVSELLGFVPDFYMVVNLKAFVTLVDTIGGIEFDIPHRMNYDDPTQDLHIHFEKGLQMLDGQKAMELMRFRGYIGSDLRRMEVQQEFLTAVAKKLLRPQTIPQLEKLSKAYADNVETDLTVGNLMWLASGMLNSGSDNIHMGILPTFTTEKEENPNYYQYVSTKAALKMINESLNPFEEEITSSNISHPQP
jgi:LCP family protein required for cell wall assembly